MVHSVGCSQFADSYHPLATLACTALYERLIARGKHKKTARIAVARTLLLQAGSVMRHGKAFTIPEEYLKEKTANCTA